VISSHTIIVGGGPAGSTCAWELRRHGISVLILDKHSFPRPKICAGWITPRVFNALQIEPDEYPFTLGEFNRITFAFWSRQVPIRTRQYAIRRYEFDHWLLKRSKAEIHPHQVREIRLQEDWYVVDGIYRCRHLVGAGGTHCPVYKTFFEESTPRQQRFLIAAMEEEFAFTPRDPHCYLWFFDHGLPGYAWYVPKGKDWINVGIGGRLMTLKKQNKTIRHYWDLFAQKLESLGLITNYDFRPKGYTYYLRHTTNAGRIRNAFVVGDAAGLATLDMGEGIGPAVESGLQAAAAIMSGQEYRFRSIPKYSLRALLFPGKKQPW